MIVADENGKRVECRGDVRAGGARDGNLLGGERIYASERCTRLMAGGELIDEIAGG